MLTNMSFDFLKSIRFKEETPAEKPSVGKNPEGLALRVFTNGKVFPSPQLVEKFKLEYGVEGECGIDFFTAHNWGIYPKTSPNIIFIAFTPRTQPKIDLFSIRRNGTTSVMDQAPSSPELLEAIKLVQPSTDLVANKFVDLVVEDIAVQPEDGICYMPKTVVRGERKGQLEAFRRENVTLYPVRIVVATTTVENASDDVEQEDLVSTLNSSSL